jgi:two-component system, LytTR family, sensor histidine kinase AlgZ
MTTASMTDFTSIDSVATPPFWIPVLAGLPITLCMLVMGLPDFGLSHFAEFRAMFVVAYIVWSVPLALIQRSLWRRRIQWWFSIPGLLALTYVLSLVNSALGQLLMVHWGLASQFIWGRIFSGLDGCWLALIAFCAIHAVVAYYFALRAEKQRVLNAVSLARDAELRALRYQLHPHFLFNTLNAISALVVEGRPLDATRMIARLGDFLRATLESGEAHEVPLADELSLTEHYLDIEKARLGHRLDMNLSVGPDVLRALVPGLGLRNVRERLVKLYGDNHRFELCQAVDGSCEVSIELPFRLAGQVANQQAVVR